MLNNIKLGSITAPAHKLQKLIAKHTTFHLTFHFSELPSYDEEYTHTHMLMTSYLQLYMEDSIPIFQYTLHL